MGLAGDGSTILIQALDSHSGFILSGALPTKEGHVCARWFWDHWVRIFCLASRVVTDQGTEFVNQFNNAINEYSGMLHETTAPYHPAANGKIERAHGTYMTMLRKTTGASDMPRWPLALAATDMALTRVCPAQLRCLRSSLGLVVDRSLRYMWSLVSNQMFLRLYRSGLGCCTVLVKPLLRLRVWLVG
jgi:transposase InsO family protein